VLLPLVAATIQPSAGDGIVWHWDRESAGCALRQDVGDRDTVLEISRTPGNDQTSLVIKGSKPIRATQKTFQGGTINFQPTGQADSELIAVEGYDGRREIHAMSYDPDFLNRFSGATEVEFAHQRIGQTRVPIRNAKAAADALRICEDTKMREWGIDPVAWRALRIKPTPETSPRGWLSWLDYPDREKIYKNDITVVARLDLGADGSVQNCTVVNKPPSEFIGAACKALRQNAKLKPARDAVGNGTAASYVIQVTFGAFPL
jgi:Gram-negative bacterial TonB protein C-terminal